MTPAHCRHTFSTVAFGIAFLTTACGEPGESPADKNAPTAPPGPIVEIAASSKQTPPTETQLSDLPVRNHWSQFRGPDGSGIATGATPPVEWGDGKNISWKTPIPGSGSSSPIVWKNAVFVTSHSGYGESPDSPGNMNQLRLMVHRLDLDTGKLAWTRSITPTAPVNEYQKRMQLHGYATSTPTTDGERVYCFFGNNGVHAFDYSGTAVWKAEVGRGTHGWGSASSPVLYENLIIINAYTESKSLVALDRVTGKEAWRTGGLNETWSTPHLVRTSDGKTELVMAHFGEVAGYNPLTGEKLWTCQGPRWYSVGSLVSHEGIVYGTYGKGYEATFAIRSGGRGDVSETHRLWEARKGSNVSSPVYHDGHLYLVHEGAGIAYCLDAKSGNIVYEERIPYRLGEVYSSPVLAGGNLYHVSRNRGTAIIAAKPSFAAVAHNPALDDTVFNASPAVAGNRLLLRSAGALYCLGQP